MSQKMGEMHLSILLNKFLITLIKIDLSAIMYTLTHNFSLEVSRNFEYSINQNYDC